MIKLKMPWLVILKFLGVGLLILLCVALALGLVALVVALCGWIILSGWNAVFVDYLNVTQEPMTLVQAGWIVLVVYIVGLVFGVATKIASGSLFKNK